MEHGADTGLPTDSDSDSDTESNTLVLTLVPAKFLNLISVHHQLFAKMI